MFFIFKIDIILFKSAIFEGGYYGQQCIIN